MLNLNTAFGDPFHHGWPAPQSAWADQHGSVIFSPLVIANVVSGLRLIVGFTLSILIGSILGALMWRWRPLNDFLGPLFLGMQTLPSVCWVPLAYIAFGYNESGVQFVLVMGSLFGIAISLRDGLRTIPPLYQRAGMMLGAGGWRLYRYVLLPASLPAIASGLRQGFGFAWRSLMGAEFVFMIDRHGLGFLLQVGRDTNDVAQVVAVMIMMVILGMLADRLAFAKIERRVYKRFGLVGHK